MIVHPQLKHFDQSPAYKEKTKELLQAKIEKRLQTNCLSSLLFLIATQPLSAATDGLGVESSSAADEKSSEKKKNLSLDDDDESDGILGFSSQHGHLSPTIAVIARDVLAIPATNCVERVFSKSEAMITDKRTNTGVGKN